MDGTSFDRMARLLGATASRRTGLLAALGMALGLTAAASEEEVLAVDAAGDEAEAEKKKKKRKRCRPSLIGKGTKKLRRRSRCRKGKQCCSLLCKGKRRKKKKHHHKKDGELTGLLAAGVELDEYGFDEEGYEEYLEEDDEDEDEELQGFTFAGEVDAEKKKRRRRRRRCRCRRLGATCKVDKNCCPKDGAAVKCVNGVCGSEPGPGPDNSKIPTSKACTKQDVCKDANAACTTYEAGTPAGTYCLLPDGGQCTKNADCENASCLNGECKPGNRPPVPTGQACGAGDVCADVLAECAAYDSGDPAGTYCLLQATEPCTGNNDCQSQLCANGACKARILLGQACAQDDLCKDALAECTTYQSNQPSGTYCLLAAGESTCATDNDCITQVCTSGTCTAYQPGLAEVCGASSATDTCSASSNATCQTYTNSWQNSNGDQYFCTLDTGETCSIDVGDCACKSSACNGGTCCDTDSGLQPNNTRCSSNADCCSNLCQTMGVEDTYQWCISPDQIWTQVTYTGGSDSLDLYVITGQDIPYTYGTTFNAAQPWEGTNLPFKTSGGALYWFNSNLVPDDINTECPTGPGSLTYPNGDGDPYCRNDSGNPYTALIAYQSCDYSAVEGCVTFANTRPGYKYRIMATFEGQCDGDQYSVDACGPNWTELGTKGIWQTNAQVKVFKGSTQVGATFTVTNPGGTNPLRKYWWWIADVIYDDNNQPTVHRVNTLHECLPIPYALDGGTVTNGLRSQQYQVGYATGLGWSNWCTPIPWVTSS